MWAAAGVSRSHPKHLPIKQVCPVLLPLHRSVSCICLPPKEEQGWQACEGLKGELSAEGRWTCLEPGVGWDSSFLGQLLCKWSLGWRAEDTSPTLAPNLAGWQCLLPQLPPLNIPLLPLGWQPEGPSSTPQGSRIGPGGLWLPIPGLEKETGSCFALDSAVRGFVNFQESVWNALTPSLQ